MSSGAWIERRWWWIPLVALVLLNTLAMIWYALVYSGLARTVDQQLERRRRDLAGAEAAVAASRQAAESLRHNEEELAEFYSTRLAPPSERLTDVIREVRTLARTAGLQPAAIDYPLDDLEEFGLVKRSVSFAVQGSYEQLRQFINLLELTDSFLTLEEVQLTGRGDESQLRISLKVSTLFVVEPPAAEADSAEQSEAPAP